VVELGSFWGGAILYLSAGRVAPGTGVPHHDPQHREKTDSHDNEADDVEDAPRPRVAIPVPIELTPHDRQKGPSTALRFAPKSFERAGILVRLCVRGTRATLSSFHSIVSHGSRLAGNVAVLALIPGREILRFFDRPLIILDSEALRQETVVRENPRKGTSPHSFSEGRALFTRGAIGWVWASLAILGLWSQDSRRGISSSSRLGRGRLDRPRERVSNDVFLLVAEAEWNRSAPRDPSRYQVRVAYPDGRVDIRSFPG